MKHPKPFTSSLSHSNDLWCLLSSVSSVTSKKDTHHGQKTRMIAPTGDATVDKWYTFIFYIYIFSISRCYCPKRLPIRNTTPAIHSKEAVTWEVRNTNIHECLEMKARNIWRVIIYLFFYQLTFGHFDICSLNISW